MSQSGRNVIGKAVLVAASVVWSARLPVAVAEEPALQAPDSADRPDDDVARLADAIDAHVEAAWRENEVAPAPLADDAEFLRRASLDLGGRIPSAWEVREFLADDDPHKRRLVVDRLLENPLFYSQLAVKLRMRLLPQAGADLQLQFQFPQFEVWLRHKLVADIGYDELVRDLLAIPFKENERDIAAIFYSARQGKPEDLAAATSRLFLGVRLECAQCHDHPFAHWKQDDFWRQAAFFAGMEGDMFGRLTESPETHTIQIPDSDRVVEAAFLNGETPELIGRNPREVFADWLADSANPYFARVAANRVWAELFGVGIVDPADDFDESNPPSHPELLDQLASDFAAHEFDVSFLIRAITASRTYQLTSGQTDPSQLNPRLFARHTARALSGDQLYDSLVQAMGAGNDRGFANRNDDIDSPRNRFRELFESQADHPAESQTTILQALAMMNGQTVQSATDVGQNRTLAAVLEADFFTDPERIEALFLTTLSRFPQPEELERMTAYIAERSGGHPEDTAARVAAFGDVFWALINSSEFVVNH